MKSLIILFIISSGLYSQNLNESNQIKDKISSIENSLYVAKNDSIRFSLIDRMNHYKIAGVSICVFKNYKIEFIKHYGYADKSLQLKITDSTLFLAGSNSKSVNAFGIYKLIQDKKLKLDDEINKHLIEYKFTYDSMYSNKIITIKNLLSHTAGLNVHGFLGYKKDAILPSTEEILDSSSKSNSHKVCIITPPDSKFLYSGGGTTILQKIIEDISQQEYEEFMRKEVLKPLGMHRSSFEQPPKKYKNNLSKGYDSDGNIIDGGYHLYPEKAAAGLWTNSNELAKFVIEIQKQLKCENKDSLDISMNQMLTPYIDTFNALGFFIKNKNGTKYFTHGGKDEGFVSTYIGSMDGGNGATIMVNSDNYIFLEELVKSIAVVYNWNNYYKPKKNEN